MKRFLLPALSLLLIADASAGDAQLSAWFTQNSGQYARIYATTATETARTPVSTWSRGSGTQSLPAYSGVHEISYSANWIYIRTTGLASHVMGPWYLDAAKSQLFPNYPSNTAKIYRIPRMPNTSGTGGTTGLGAAGVMVNGVALFDMRDAFSYSHGSATDATPVNGVTGDGIWNREAYHNEAVSFDAALAHQAGNQYHYHAQPIALRYQLGDHVDYNATTNRYAESAAAPTKHSPILAWAWDGLPVYGPYGYSNPLDSGSGVRRMLSGFVLRNGQNGTANLTSTGRTTLPAWAARIQGRSAALSSAQYGPDVSATYALGHYLEDYDYLGDLSGSGYDLDESNARYCVTPEFPSGTWAYFTTITADGTPVFPYNTGRRYKGSSTGGEVASIGETVTTVFQGGPNADLKTIGLGRDSGTGAVTLTWSSVDGGAYKVEASGDLAAWSAVQTAQASGGVSTSFTESAAAQGGAAKRFYRVSRTALASYDTTGFTTGGAGGGTAGNGIVSVSPLSGARGSTVTLTINLDAAASPAPPPQTAPINSVTVGTITGASNVHVSQTQVTSSITIPANAATGPQTVTVVFPGPPGNPTNVITYTLTNGFTIQ